MRKMNRILPWGLALCFGVLTGACGDGDSRSLSLREAPKPAVELDAEHARIKQMQSVSVQDITDPENPVTKQIGVGELSGIIRNSGIEGCLPRYTNDDPPPNGNHAAGAAEVLKSRLCVARTLQTVASLRAQPLSIGSYIVPPQSSATNVAILGEAQSLIVNGMYWFGWFYGLHGWGLDEDVPDSTVPVGQLLAELYSDGYALYHDVTHQKVDLILAVADSERGSTPNLELSQARQFAQLDLSRAAAAHELVGGVPGIHGDETSGFCSSPELSAQGQRALGVLRQTGVAPGLVLASNLSQADFIDGSRLLVPAGSVRERYKVFVDKSIPDGKSLGDYLKLDVDDFVAARRYLASEITAFGRSLTTTGQTSGSLAPPPSCVSTIGFNLPGDLASFDSNGGSGVAWAVGAGLLSHTRGVPGFMIHKTELVTDGYVEARIQSATDSDYAGLTFRYTSSARHYLFVISEQTGMAYLYGRVDGALNVLDSVSLTGFDWAPGHTLRVSGQGSRLTASLDGQVILAANDSVVPSGKAGVFADTQMGGWFDDFSVYSTTRTAGCGESALPASFAWYAATGTAPQERSDEYWSTLARFETSADSSAFGDDSHPVVTGMGGPDGVSDDSLAEFVDTSLFLAQDALNNLNVGIGGPNKTAIVDKAASPLLRILAQGKVERPGRVILRGAAGGSTTLVNVYGYASSTGLRLVDAENLSCAVMGHVEGQPCTVTFKYSAATTLPSVDLADFKVGSTFTITRKPGQKLYLVKPITPGDLKAGRFEAVVGFDEPALGIGDNHVIPITPAIAKRAAEVFKPSRAWCSYPAVGCDGQEFGDKVKFDARLPLENELTNDSNGVESSWRHSLDLAKQAAAEANLLAEQYMNAGLELDRGTEAEQLREAQDRIRFMSRAEGELETIQNVCGTAVETTALLKQLGLKPPQLSDATQCTVDSDCPSPIRYVQTQCVAGRCIATQPLLDDRSEETYSRLQACIGQDSVVDWATIGNSPVCVWETGSGLCTGDTRGACPSLARKVPNSSQYTCDGTMAKLFMPSGATMRPVITNTIGVADNSDESSFVGPCNSVRELREASLDPNRLSPDIRAALLRNLDVTAVFSKAKLKREGLKVAFEAVFGNYSTVYYEGNPLFQTLQPDGQSWPCASAESTSLTCLSSPLPSSCALDCSKTPHSLLCQSATCSNWDSRTAINSRLMNAVWASQGLTVAYSKFDVGFSGDDVVYPKYSQLRLPVKYNMNNTVGTFPIAAGDNVTTPARILYPNGAVGQATKYLTTFGGAAYTSDQPVDLWADLRNPGQRLKLTNNKTVFYAIEPLIATTGRFWTNQLRASLGWGENAAGGSPTQRLEVWNGVTRYDPPMSANSYFSGTMFNLFAGRGGAMRTFDRLNATDPTPVIDYYAVPNGHAAEYNAFYSSATPPIADRYSNPVADRYPQMDYQVPTLQYTDDKLWDAAELMCEFSRKSEGWINYLSTAGACPEAPLTFNSEAEISAVRASLMCKAEVVRRRANNVILQRIPRAAYENLLEFNSSRAFPQLGGEMGVAVSRLRESLIRIRNGQLEISSQVNQLQGNLDQFFYTLKQVGIRKSQTSVTEAQAGIKIAQEELKIQQIEIEKDGTFLDGLLTWSNAAISGISTYGAGTALAAASAFNEDAKAEQRAGYQTRLAEFEKSYWQGERTKAQSEQKSLDFEKHKVLGELEFELHRGAIAINQVVNNMRADVEGVDGEITAIETLALKVKRSISRLSTFESSEAAITPQLRGVMTARLDVSRRRYQAAHLRAVRYAFLAKRAIEQRLGMHLAEMREDMPLVEAPQKWESGLCRSTGVNYEVLKGGPGRAGDLAKITNYADPFIGDYVDKLGDVVESYTLRYGFKDATDEAIVSLRDDIDNVRKDCKVTSLNLLAYTGQLEPIVSLKPEELPGWTITGCTPDAETGNDGCLVSTQGETPDLVGLDGQVRAYDLSFPVNSRLTQTVTLEPGRYRLSWYIKSPGAGAPEQAMRVYTLAGTEISYSYAVQEAPIDQSNVGDWTRQYRGFDISVPGEYRIAFVGPASGSLTVAAPFLENITTMSNGAANVAELPPLAFQLTKETRETVRKVCPDIDGQEFRQTKWERGCTSLCETGFGDQCSSAPQCYWETTFSISQREIERGLIFNQSGFAKGNFNYRTEGIGVNFVGSGLRSCETSETPGPCNGAGFVPYSLYHLGPFTVTNHLGRPFQAQLFEGAIEHARGLGVERYLTNPISSADRGLLDSYVRREYEGRPIDGNYRLRVWDSPGLQFSAIQDAQIYLKYRYWTRTN